MRFSAYAGRILRDKVKLLLIVLLLLIPMGDIAQMLQELYYAWGQGWELKPPDPRYAAFAALSTVGTSHMLHKIMFWFLPIYLLIITGEDSLEDYDLGYSNALKSRMSRKQYIFGKAKNSFCFSFSLIFLSLMLNYVLLQFIFDRGGTVVQDPNILPSNFLYVMGYYHPMLLSVVNIFLTAVLSGLIGLIGTGMAMYFHDRKMVYGITFMLWFVFVLLDDGLMTILHPFADTPISNYVIGVLLMVVGYSVIALVTLMAEVKSNEV